MTRGGRAGLVASTLRSSWYGWSIVLAAVATVVFFERLDAIAVADDRTTGSDVEELRMGAVRELAEVAALARGEANHSDVVSHLDAVVSDLRARTTSSPDRASDFARVELELLSFALSNGFVSLPRYRERLDTVYETQAELHDGTSDDAVWQLVRARWVAVSVTDGEAAGMTVLREAAQRWVDTPASIIIRLRLARRLIKLDGNPIEARNEARDILSALEEEDLSESIREEAQAWLYEVDHLTPPARIPPVRGRDLAGESVTADFESGGIVRCVSMTCGACTTTPEFMRRAAVALSGTSAVAVLCVIAEDGVEAMREQLMSIDAHEWPFRIVVVEKPAVARWTSGDSGTVSRLNASTSPKTFVVRPGGRIALVKYGRRGDPELIDGLSQLMKPRASQDDE